jgi:hypothetical protein
MTPKRVTTKDEKCARKHAPPCPILSGASPRLCGRVEGSRRSVPGGVNPSVETVRKLPGYRSLKLARRTGVVGRSMGQLRKRRRALRRQGETALAKVHAKNRLVVKQDNDVDCGVFESLTKTWPDIERW